MVRLLRLEKVVKDGLYLWIEELDTLDTLDWRG